MRKAAIAVLLLLLPAAVFAQDDSWRDRPGDRRDPGDRPRVRDRWRDPDDRDRVRRGRRDANMFELTPILGYRYGGTIESDRGNDLFDFDTQLESAPNAGVIFGIPVGWNDTKIELMVSHQSTELETDEGLFVPDEDLADIDVTYYHAGVSIPFAQSRNATPYIVLSAGVANLDVGIRGLESENRFSMSAGIGVKVPISRNIGFRFETRGYFTALDSDDDDDCRRCEEGNALAQGETSIGVVFRF